MTNSQVKIPIKLGEWEDPRCPHGESYFDCAICELAYYEAEDAKREDDQPVLPESWASE